MDWQFQACIAGALTEGDDDEGACPKCKATVKLDDLSPIGGGSGGSGATGGDNADTGRECPDVLATVLGGGYVLCFEDPCPNKRWANS